ncbi:hypothetical protein ACP70R_023162 [Stipagrostis hirtigluma subsp. patula]
MVELRLRVLAAVIVLSTVAGIGSCGGFVIEEATIDAIQRGFRNGSLTSEKLVKFYLDRINSAPYGQLRAVIEVNPDALQQAKRADGERRSRGSRGRLHGVPVLVKDNIATFDKLNTTAGSYALLGSAVRRDAGVVRRLRSAGAVILGKANPSEWSNFRRVKAGWSARGGQTLNPYNFLPTPCGSSAGPAVAAAANLAAVTLGTETDGSILCPSSMNAVVGIKPTVGLTSRSGVIPISPRQDSVGPICRTVSDAADVLDAIVGEDTLDKATKAASKYIPRGGYRQFLKIDGLKGKRIGVPSAFFDARILDANVLKVYEQHLSTTRKLGANVITGLNISINFTDLITQEHIALAAEFKSSLNAYLSDLDWKNVPKKSTVRSLADLIAFNKNNSKRENLMEFPQDQLIAAEKTKGTGAKEIIAAIKRLNEISTTGLEKLMKEQKLDAILAPNNTASSILAVGGYPGIIVPAGYDSRGVPFGLCFGGLQGYEPRLIEMAYAFEQATKVRRPPPTPKRKLA